MEYSQALAYVSALAPKGWRLGLDRMEEFARRARLLESPPKFIHIAGTNGKGSVTAFTQAILEAAGHRTGAFFSPFVYDPRERVQANGSLISEEDFARIVAELAPIAEEMEATEFQGPTEFEFKTAVGFRHWQEQFCEWVALEVGLGARLDATNIVDPAASIVTSIGLDHQKILGPTEELIAVEKGGVIKPGRPIVIGQMAEGPRKVLLDLAQGAGAPAHIYGRDFEVHADANGAYELRTTRGRYEGLRLGLKGSMQPHNLALAVVALEQAEALGDDPDRAVREGALKAFCPGRYERRGEFLLDGAHNPQAAQTLVESLKAEGLSNLVLVTSMVNGHESDPFYEALQQVVREAHVGPIDFPRAQSPDEIAASLDRAGIPVTAHESVEAAVKAAQEAAGPGETVLVTGSFYFVGEVGNFLATIGK